MKKEIDKVVPPLKFLHRLLYNLVPSKYVHIDRETTLLLVTLLYLMSSIITYIKDHFFTCDFSHKACSTIGVAHGKAWI